MPYELFKAIIVYSFVASGLDLSQTTSPLSEKAFAKPTSPARVLLCHASRGKKDKHDPSLSEIERPEDDSGNVRLSIPTLSNQTAGSASLISHRFPLGEVTVTAKLEGALQRERERPPYACLTISARYKDFEASSSRCQDGDLSTMELSVELISRLSLGGDEYEYVGECQLVSPTEAELKR